MNDHKVLEFAERLAAKGYDAKRIRDDTEEYIRVILHGPTQDHNTLAFFMRGLRAAITNNTKEQ